MMSTVARTMYSLADRLDPEAAAGRAKHKDHAKNKSVQHKLDLKWLLSSPAGRRIVYDILEKTGLNGSTLVDGVPSAVLEGRRTVGRDLVVEILAVDHSAYLLMQREALDNAINANKS